MRKINIKLVVITILSICLLSVNAYAHSGRTDSNGGHRDTKNKSGLGSYHYHCGGHPAHLHPNGVCPYSTSSTKSSTSSSASSSKVVETKPATVEVSSIKINEVTDIIEEGKTKFLSATISPENATDKNITWKSSDESIATVSSIGTVTAIKPGTVDIIASTSNGKSDTIQITIKEKTEVKNNSNNTSLYNSNNNTVRPSINNNKNLYSSNNKQDDLSALWGILAVSALGGGGYYGYNKYKRK